MLHANLIKQTKIIREIYALENIGHLVFIFTIYSQREMKLKLSFKNISENKIENREEFYYILNNKCNILH